MYCFTGTNTKRLYEARPKIASSTPTTDLHERAAQAIKVVEGKLVHGVLMPPRDLFYTLGLGFVIYDDFSRLVIQCYRLAKNEKIGRGLNKRNWMQPSISVTSGS